MTRNHLWTRGLLPAVAIVAMAMLATGCGSDSGSTPSATETVSSQSAPVRTAPSQDPRSATPSTTTRDASSEGTDPAPAATASAIRPALANVDREAFASNGGAGQAYYFQSPSGNVRCGLGITMVRIPAACQANTSVPSSTGVTCRNGGNSVYASELVDGAARSRCVNQPFYVGNTITGQPTGTFGGRVLAYGQTISVGGVTCTSQTDGITCSGFGVGFTMSRDRNDIF